MTIKYIPPTSEHLVPIKQERERERATSRVSDCRRPVFPLQLKGKPDSSQGRKFLWRTTTTNTQIPFEQDRGRTRASQGGRGTQVLTRKEENRNRFWAEKKQETQISKGNERTGSPEAEWRNSNAGDSLNLASCLRSDSHNLELAVGKASSETSAPWVPLKCYLSIKTDANYIYFPPSYCISS